MVNIQEEQFHGRERKGSNKSYILKINFKIDLSYLNHVRNTLKVRDPFVQTLCIEK